MFSVWVRQRNELTGLSLTNGEIPWDREVIYFPCTERERRRVVKTESSIIYVQIYLNQSKINKLTSSTMAYTIWIEFVSPQYINELVKYWKWIFSVYPRSIHQSRDVMNALSNYNEKVNRKSLTVSPMSAGDSLKFNIHHFANNTRA